MRVVLNMGKVMDWLKNNWLVAGITVLSVVVLLELIGILRLFGLDKQALSILLGGCIGSVITLDIAKKKQKTYSRQVQVQAEQSFNDGLRRGIEFLENKDVSVRSTGVSILINLAKNATEEQKSIVGNAIDEFFREKLRIKRDHNGKCLTEKVGQDVQNILDFIIATSLDEREKLFPNRLVNDVLDFRDLNFSHLHFTSRTLKNIDFSNSHFHEAKFENDEIIKVCFYGATIEFSDFGMDHGYYLAHMSLDFPSLPPKVIICDCEFSNTSMEHTIFCNMSIKHTEFSDIHIREVTFDEVEFLGGRFYCRYHIKLSANSKLPYFVGTCFASAKFTFGNGFKPDDFFKSCYYNVDELPSADIKNIGASQGAKSVDEMLVFVKSGQPAEEQVAVEIVEWKIAQAKKTGSDTTELESELKVAKKDLQVARKRQNKAKTP